MRKMLGSVALGSEIAANSAIAGDVSSALTCSSGRILNDGSHRIFFVRSIGSVFQRDMLPSGPVWATTGSAASVSLTNPFAQENCALDHAIS